LLCYSIAIMIKPLLAILLLAASVEVQPIQKKAQTDNPQQGQEATQQQSAPAPTPATTPSNQQKTANDKGQTQTKTWDWHEAITPPTWPNWALVLVGLGATVAALITVCYLHRQTAAMQRQEIAMRRQTRVAIDTAKKQLRAYVHVEKGLLKFSGSIVEGQIHIQNFGQTPAYDVRHWIHLWIERWPLQIVLPEPPEDFQMSKGILGPSGTHIMVGQLGGNAGPAPEMTLGQHPMRTVYVYGRVTYKDVFGDERYTEYRHIFGGREAGRKFNDANGVLCGRLREDQEGNNAN
jgi:hypothetical protein